MKGTKIQTVQGSLTDLLHPVDVDSIHASIKEKSLHWFKWIRNLTKGDGACSKWLEALPTCKDHPVLDPYGHHLASGCFIGGHGSDTHYSLVRKMNNILHYGGFNLFLSQMVMPIRKR